jgi:hypothetical protein
MRQILRAFACVALAAQLGACAAVMKGTTQSVFVETPMAEGASCKLADSKNGIWYLPATPGPVSVHKGDGPMNVTCTKDDYFTETATVDEKLEGAVFGNILIGGLVGIVADSASGAAQRYPDKITVWLKPKTWKSPDEHLAWLDAKARFDAEEAAKKTTGGPPPQPAVGYNQRIQQQPQTPQQQTGTAPQPAAPQPLQQQNEQLVRQLQQLQQTLAAQQKQLQELQQQPAPLAEAKALDTQTLSTTQEQLAPLVVQAEQQAQQPTNTQIVQGYARDRSMSWEDTAGLPASQRPPRPASANGRPW